MRKWKANSYVLSVCVLIAEFVRQQQDVQRSGEDSVASIVDGKSAPAPSSVSRSMLNQLAGFLCVEIQHPLRSHSQDRGFTSLKSLLKRLEQTLDSKKDYEQLSWQLVSILSQIDSPDAVCNAVEQISECVAPLPTPREDGETDVDSVSSTLARTSLLGVFVRSFLLAVNRLLFDGLSRLFDDVLQYLEQFKEDFEQDKRQEQERKDSSFEVLGSPRSSSQHLWEEGKQEEDGFSLSPIQSSAETPMKPELPELSLSTPAPTRLMAGGESAASVSIPEPVCENNDPALWSNDQLNYILNDMVQEMEGGRSDRQSQNQHSPGGQSPEGQLRQIREKMDETNPNVLFAKYLSFLRDRDYQGALDSLHQYHDVLSPRQEPRLGTDSNSSGTTGATNVSGAHFRGSGIQYAALNLAGLQIVFDRHEAAQDCIQEAIRVAQHHGDHICVAFALAWLIRINQKLGKPKEFVLQLVTSCLERAEELRLPSLKVLATLTDVENELTRGNTRRTEPTGWASKNLSHVFTVHAPAPRALHIWSRLQETTRSIVSISTPAFSLSGNGPRVMNALQAQMNSAAEPFDRTGGTGMEWVKSTEAILDTIWKLSGKIVLSAAVGWGLFGHRSLEQVFNRIHLMCYEDSASSCEVAMTVGRMAISSAAEDNAVCIYERGLRFLVNITVNNPSRQYLIHEASFQRNLNYMFFLWALQRGEFGRAEVHLNGILMRSPEDKDFPGYLESLTLKARLFAASGDFLNSIALLERLETTCAKLGLSYLLAQVLIASSRTRCQATAPHSPFASLNTLLKCVDICRSHHYDLLLAEAHVVMAEIYIAMGKLQDAYSLINEQMPLVMEHGGIDLRGECLLVLAKTMVASIKRAKSGTKEPPISATKALELLDASRKIFSAVQNGRRLKEVSYVQSIVYNHFALQAERCGEDSAQYCAYREQAAAAFLQHSSELKRAPFRTIEPFFDLGSSQSIQRVITHRSSEC